MKMQRINISITLIIFVTITVFPVGLQAAGRAAQRHQATLSFSFSIYCNRLHDLCGQGQEQLGKPAKCTAAAIEEK